ncbi:hypothetical protein FHR83_007088 [Actinoplanes campanulatus]|uniref:Uncharacterized protein n=1 Tax=Actinoplanes campanulatus TaxID=113559 RepID=A0A7W5ANQ2_9ACTN|nr:hypothetical protein [Actinoplanes campanulatus]MBB3099382.1 hypothetical protein [Actinoplanes campanulatus]
MNIPGYLPMDDEPPVFDTAREAWEYLRAELERGELAWMPNNPEDPEGPQSCAPAALEIDLMVERDREGTVYGPSRLDGDCTHDLGLAYSVVWLDHRTADDLLVIADAVGVTR